MNHFDRLTGHSTDRTLYLNLVAPLAFHDCNALLDALQELYLQEQMNGLDDSAEQLLRIREVLLRSVATADQWFMEEPSLRAVPPT